MRKWISLLFIAIASVIFSFSSGSAQMLAFPGALGAQAPFFYMPPVNPLYAPVPFFPLPFCMSPSRIATPRPLLAPMGVPLPVRYPAATITIIFDPTLSVVNVSAVPLASIPVAPVLPTAVVAAPAPAPSALLALLPALISAVPTKPYTQTQTISTTATTVAPVVPTGLTALLPLI